MSDSKELTNALSFDGLAAAEALTGKSYKEDRATMMAGMAMMMRSNKATTELLKANKDSHFGMSLDEVIDIYLEMGFEEVLHDMFNAETIMGKPLMEHFIVMWHPDGLLAKIESYQSTGVNTHTVFYAIKFDEAKMVENQVRPWSLTSSGGMNGKVWVGHYEARQGIRHHLDQLRANGEFQKVWPERPFLWLLTYTDSKVEGYDYNAITRERVMRLPQHVQDAIGPEETKLRFTDKGYTTDLCSNPDCPHAGHCNGYCVKYF